MQEEAVLAAQRSLVTEEETVDELEPRPGGVVLPSWVASTLAAVPGGAHPAYALAYCERDDDSCVARDAISRERRRFLELRALFVVDDVDGAPSRTT